MRVMYNLQYFAELKANDSLYKAVKDTIRTYNSLSNNAGSIYYNRLPEAIKKYIVCPVRQK